ncbi:hypothetical protein FSC37_03700 [Piscinibacter aquaticus]|uniref:Sodium/calcium exchanger membrane region domain-containing protein n=1 Tax=Piscinibacter aquaticus TaxID=392597 RepID=A0A5C6TZ84_9BURK|nr:hypothetical protein FSC37_03700 [Piscinibacter aquaticus]
MALLGLALQFLLCAVLIAAAGFVLSRSADALAEAHGWGRGWVGLALLATVTSLPELASGVSAVALVGAPNPAVGNALGACVVNLAFLVVVDLLQRHQPMYGRASATHLLSAGFGVVMLGFVAMSPVTGRAAPQFLGVGLYSPVLLALYLLALRSVFAHEQSTRSCAEAAALERPSREAVRREWRRFCMAALVVLAIGSWLPEVADGLERAGSVAQFCRHGVHGAGDHAARDGGHRLGAAPGRTRHGDRQPAGQQPLQPDHPRDRRRPTCQARCLPTCRARMPARPPPR